jgi:regulator of protease activity HflC (stomatin/prohibitin superfamily)
VDDLNIINWDFSEEFISAIEAKQVAEQTLIKTRTEQEQALVIANTEAQKQVIAAQAEADKIKLLADATADSNQTIAQSLSDILIRYETLQKWDGQLPKVTNGSNTLVDIGLGQ